MIQRLTTIAFLLLYIPCVAQEVPSKVKAKYASCCAGSCAQFSYKIYEVKEKLYCFFNKDISYKMVEIKKELTEVTSYLKYYKGDKCLVLQLNDQRDRRTLQGYFTETLCN